MDILKAFIAIIDGLKLTTIFILIVADFILGVIVAIKTGTFAWTKLADFLNTSVFYYLGGYFVMGVLAMVRQEFVLAVTGAAAIMIASLLAGVIIKLKALGLPIPETLPPIKPA
jgi:hypothetical protein